MSQLGCLLIFLILHVPVSNCKFTPRNNTMSKCLTFDANCTTGPNITYPFWFPNRCQSYRGYPDLGVSCRYGVPTIKLPDGPDTYYIKGINYSDKTFDILSADLEKTSNSCPTPLNNVTLRNDTLGYAAGTDFIRIFYNCSSEPIFYPKPGPISCLNNSYWAPNSSWEDHEEGDCDSVVTYPVLQAAIRLRRVYSSPYMAFKDGFKVVWRPGDDCNKCENSGGHCGFTYESHFCECPDGLKHSGYCNNTNNNEGRRIAAALSETNPGGPSALATK